jgi:hypothetical protein
MDEKPSVLQRVMGGLMDFVSGVLNVSFQLEASQNPSLRVWTEDDLGAIGAVGSPLPNPPQPVKPLWEQAQSQIASLKTIDPDFSEVAFLEQASKAYIAVCDAQSTMSADAAGSRVTPSYLNGLRAQIAQWNSSGMRRVCKDLKLDGGTMFKVSVDGDRQVITARFTGEATRFTQDVATGAAVDGSMQPESFTEFVSFVRPAGATTPKAVGAGAPAHCPACGAPATAGAIYCSFCGTPLTGTGGVWLLDHISVSAYT